MIAREVLENRKMLQLSDLEKLEPPPIVLVSLAKGIACQPNVNLWLHHIGEQGADEAIEQALKIPARIIGNTEPPNPWVEGIISPFLDPLVKGFTDRLEERLRPVLIVGGLTISGFLLWLILRKKKR